MDVATQAEFSLFSGHRTIDERFLEFEHQHPEVYARLEDLTRQAIASGLRHVGIRMLWERMRWTFHVERRDGEFKLNDHFTSRYVRKLIEDHPEWSEVFEVRELRTL